MKTNHLLLLLSPVIFITLASCVTTTEPIGQAALKNIETRTIDAGFDRVFTAATEALFDLGYNIKHSDNKSGIILGEKADARKGEKAAMALFWGAAGALTVNPIVYNVTLLVKAIDNTTTDVRINTTIDGESKLDKEAIDQIWLYIDRQVLMETPLADSTPKGGAVRGETQVIMTANLPTTPPETIEAEKKVEPRIGNVFDVPHPTAKKSEKTKSILQSTGNIEAVEWSKKCYKAMTERQWAEVIRTASVAISLDPGMIDPYINRAWAFCEKGFFEKAIQDCNTALSLNPDSSLAHNNRGLAYSRKGEKEKALKDYEAACKMGLELACVNFKKVIVFSKKLHEDSIMNFNMGDWDKTIELCSETLKIDPNNENAYITRSEGYLKKGMLKESLADCEKAIEINPDNGVAYNNKGYALELLGKMDEATLYYEISCGLQTDLGCKNHKRISNK